MQKIKLAKSKTIRVSLKQWLLSSRGPWSPIEKMMEARSLNPSKKKKCTHTILQIITEAHSLISSTHYRSMEAQFILSRLMTTPLAPEHAT